MKKSRLAKEDLKNLENECEKCLEAICAILQTDSMLIHVTSFQEDLLELTVSDQKATAVFAWKDLEEMLFDKKRGLCAVTFSEIIYYGLLKDCAGQLSDLDWLKMKFFHFVIDTGLYRLLETCSSLEEVQLKLGIMSMP